MTKDELRSIIAKSNYFRDSEGTLEILDVRDELFIAKDIDGEIYELFYSDYVDNKQTFQVLA